MSDPLRLDIEPPRNGWTAVSLNAPDAEVRFEASYVYDSIGRLAGAVSSCLEGVPEVVVPWTTEPQEYDFRFTNGSGITRLEVHEFPDQRRRWRRAEAPVAVIEESTPAVCRALWRWLRRLQGAQAEEEYTAGWRHPFPAKVLARLSAHFHARRE